MKSAIDIAFSESVKAVQSRKGSRQVYEKLGEKAGFFTEINEYLASFIARQDSVFLASVNAEGAPYIQHRGGPAGFIKVLDKNTLAFADYKGNRQFITQGNLLDNPRAFLFLIDYESRKRIKIWGSARVIEDDPALLGSLMPDRATYRALPEQVITFTISTWDRNCPQHIPQRINHTSLLEQLNEKDARIEALQAQLAQLTSE